ncbi:putative enoyl-CoA hydratase echA8 [Variibacter gotjawalensis]|uniref:Enoyl-CoA hydratase domain-containing protein 3, mitochondrial n=1 Tax=Variibacter gotjawalensis TaxID=1333996 RepID=A0A0S3PX70_9BRAD|nr:enoyl-CoA hydratase [Variibacter gotjawalensis]NIK46351.1 enoyl-CoA hydratase/carnithine racemase [Variibacter gotjawalensis]RZS48261.1 enoyl-CoA hydratase/carnithine racemase [Variibacter gotjawalensis]BAT60521.1 putative enoyl-CoA hydratase echA8 [Variibacter gotjawalensis]
MDAAGADTPILLAERLGTVLVLTLNRPQARNPLSEAMISALGGQFAAIADDRSTRAVVLTHNGPAFSAGHDMKEMTARRSDEDGGRAYFKQLMTACSAMMQMVVRLPQPVIAAVEGVASAAGCQLVASCDLAIAGEGARFATPGVNIGLFCSTPMVALSRNVSRKHAMEMLLTGDLVDAEHAARVGLVNRVVPAGTARERASALADQIASKSTATVKVGKEAFYRQVEMDLGDAYAYTVEVMTQNMMFRDAEEGIGAFIEKRAPKWQDQ